MELSIISNAPTHRGRQLRPYQVDEIATVGVEPGEPYGIRFRNDSHGKVQVRLSIDGTDVLSGDKATLDTTGRMWVVQPYATLSLDAWPENREAGARFVFGETETSVAAHTHGDLRAKGYISAAVFVEGYQPPAMNYRSKGGFDFGPQDASFRSAPASYGARDVGLERSVRGGPATGAGEQIAQRIGSAQGLIQPEYSELIQVRYLWWDELVAKLREHGIRPAPAHPTGFEPPVLANLGTTPRPGDHAVTTTDVEYSRFAA